MHLAPIAPIGPILAALRRHPAAAALIILEIAITCAIVCNALFLIRERLVRMDRASGVAEDELIRVQITGRIARTDATALTEQDLAALRAIPGVRSAAATNMVPFSDTGFTSPVSRLPDDPQPPLTAGIYLGTADLIETLGARLIAGRDLAPEEYVDIGLEGGRLSLPQHVPAVLVTRGLAEALFPGQSPLGQRLYVVGKEPQTIVGVIDRLAYLGAPGARAAYAAVLPVRLPAVTGASYVVRVDPARRAEILAAVDGALAAVNRSRVILARQSLGELRRDFYREDRAMAYLLGGVSLALLAIAALGVIGITSAWVQQRTRQIGIRRALGATRGDIRRHFQLESFVLTTAGIALGMALAYAINLWLMSAYQVARLPAQVLPLGAAALWALGQLAVLGPARRASRIPPAIATRTV